MISGWLLAIAVMAYIYYVVLILYAGRGATFVRFWLMVSGVAGVLSGVLYYLMKRDIKIPFQCWRIIMILVGMSILIFLIIECQIIYYAYKKPFQEADYMIILGAKVNGLIPSRALRARINKGVEYLKMNPQTQVIVSGGKGIGEYISEAEAMKRALYDKGIPLERIILEDRSTNTVQNINYSKVLIKKPQAKVVIVTNDFHVLRSYLIARKQGFQYVSGCSAASAPTMRLNYYTREFFALIKEKLKGHI